MNITLRQLSYLLALDRTGSFSRAAETVHVTQPALSMQIKELEAELQLVLVERLPRAALRRRSARRPLLCREVPGQVALCGKGQSLA